MARLRARNNKTKKLEPLDTVKAAFIKSNTTIPWFKPQRFIDMYEDHMILHMIDPRDDTVETEKKGKIDVVIRYKNIIEIHEKTSDDKKHKGIKIKNRGDIVSVEGDIISPVLIIVFNNDDTRVLGDGGLRDRCKMIDRLESSNVSCFNADSSSSRSGSDASQEESQESKEDQNKSKTQADGALVIDATPLDDPQSGPGSPMDDMHPDELPIPSSQPRRLIARQEEAKDDLDGYNTDHQHDNKKLDKRIVLEKKQQRFLEPLEIQCEGMRNFYEKDFKMFKKQCKISLWKEAKARLHKQGKENLNIEGQLRDSGTRMSQYGKRFDMLLSAHEGEYRYQKEILQKVLEGVKLQQVKLLQLSNSV